MAKLAGVVIAILITHLCRAQQAPLDSLLEILRRHPQEDTIRLNLLNDIAFEYAHADPKKGLRTSDMAIALAQKLGLQPKLASAYNYKAVNYASLGEDSVALGYYRQALAIHERTGNQLRIGTTCNNIAISLVNLSNYPGALEYHARAFAIFSALDEKARMANSLSNTGVIYLYLSDYDKALEYFLKGLLLFERLGNKNATGNALSNIGLVYAHLSKPVQSLAYHEKALAIFQSMGDQYGVANSLGNMGNVYHDMDSSEKALQLYRKALTISERSGDKRGIISHTSNMGIVYNDMGDYTQAFDYLQQSLRLNRAAGDKQRMAGDYHQLGKLYLQAPDSFLRHRGLAPGARYDQVIHYEQDALAVAREIGSMEVQRDAWEVLSKAYEQQKNFGASMHAYKAYVTARDSVVNSEMKQNITRREMQFEFDKREAISKAENDKQKAIAAAELDRQRFVKNTAIAGAIALLVFAVAGFVLYNKRRNAVERQKEAEFNMQVSETEMKALRAQINPHFLFNSLNSIGDYIHTHDTTTATHYTTRFAKLMRMILENSEKKEIPLAEDLHMLELYLQLERLRLANRFDYRISVADTINPAITLVPPMLLQPFVENSIWHGLSRKETGGLIHISIQQAGDMLICIVEDNGIGRTRSAQYARDQNSERSFGMRITESRIAILNKQKNAQGAVTVTDLSPGTRVAVQLPLETDV